jgi:hypothetical protein
MISVATVLEVVAIDSSRSPFIMFADRWCSEQPAKARDHGDRAEVEGSQRESDVLPPMLGER